VLNRLRMLGVRLAIDDFGTGFASLDYLHRFHVDMVKIDRSFVTPLDEHGQQSPVATAMVHMAKAFDLVVTAEGVENERQFRGVQALGCDTVQGYLFSRPVPAEEFELLLQGPNDWDDATAPGRVR
jgi:EAL domain-containing protein (putative c-di-GMP-specific phosphodiesterase class I)